MSLTVTAAQGGTGTDNGIALTVKVLTGAAAASAQDGAADSSATGTTPDGSITPIANGSIVYFAVTNVAAATAFTPAAGNTLSQNVLYTSDGDTFGTGRVTATTTEGTPVTAGASAPTETTNNLDWAAAEILASGTLAEDASSPAGVSITTATTITTAAFNPPAGSLLVAQVSSNGTGSGTFTMAVSGGGLTWTQLAGTTYARSSIWIAQVPAAAVPVAAQPGPSWRRQFQPWRRAVQVPRSARIPVTYYVSPSGSDSSSGTSQSAPWQTIAKVNAATLHPGDTVLFQGGQTFSGTMLQPAQGGTAGQPVTFGSYGTGQATITTSASTAIYVYEVGGITVENLTITGPGASTAGAGGYVGVYFNRDIAGYSPPITVTGCTITGWADGILAAAADAGGGYSGITITGNSVSACRDSGINVAGSGYSHQNVTVSGNTVYNQTGYSGNTTTSSGHGIVVGNANGGTVSYNTAYGNGGSCGCTTAGPVGIWGYTIESVVFEYNVSYGNLTASPGNADGDGFDLDDQCVNCVLQYNIAYSNDGAGIACYSDDSTWSGNVIRYNLTWGNSVTNPDEAELMLTGGPFADTQIYGNTFIGQANAELPSVVLLYGASFTSVNLWNNIFYTAASGVALIYADTAYTGITFQGNLYYSAAPFVINWGGTSYSSMAAWQTATGQEKLSGSNVGMQANPLLVNPGTAPTVTSPYNLSGADGLQLQSGSPAASTGLNLQSLFSVNPGSQDYFGDALATPLWVGAYQGALPAVAGSAVLAPMGTSGTVTISGTPITVTATEGGSTGPGILIRVKVLTGVASQAVGATAIKTNSSAATLEQAITTTVPGSVVYGAVNRNASGGLAAAASTTLFDDVEDPTNGVTYGTCRTTSATGTPGSVTVGATTSDQGNVALAEILPSSAGITEAGSPADVSSTTAHVISTAGFVVQPGQFLVAMVASDGGTGTASMSVSDSSGLTWTKVAFSAAADIGSAGVWTARVPYPAAVPVAAQPGPSWRSRFQPWRKAAVLRDPPPTLPLISAAGSAALAPAAVSGGVQVQPFPAPAPAALPGPSWRRRFQPWRRAAQQRVQPPAVITATGSAALAPMGTAGRAVVFQGAPLAALPGQGWKRRFQPWRRAAAERIEPPRVVTCTGSAALAPMRVPDAHGLVIGKALWNAPDKLSITGGTMQ